MTCHYNPWIDEYCPNLIKLKNNQLYKIKIWAKAYTANWQRENLRSCFSPDTAKKEKSLTEGREPKEISDDWLQIFIKSSAMLRNQWLWQFLLFFMNWCLYFLVYKEVAIKSTHLLKETLSQWIYFTISQCYI
jgi:hypothetical protein